MPSVYGNNWFIHTHVTTALEKQHGKKETEMCNKKGILEVLINVIKIFVHQNSDMTNLTTVQRKHNGKTKQKRTRK